MPAETITMRKIREVLGLKFDCDISNRQIAKSCNIAHNYVLHNQREIHHQNGGTQWKQCSKTGSPSSPVPDAASEKPLHSNLPKKGQRSL